MSVCVLQKPEKYRVLWTDFLGSWREINRFSVSKIGPEPAKPTISLALIWGIHRFTDRCENKHFFYFFISFQLPF